MPLASKHHDHTVKPLLNDNGWQQQLREAYREPLPLLEQLQLDSPEPLAKKAAAQSRFKMLVPRAFVERMRVGNYDDPLLRQVLPLGDECIEMDGFNKDPVADHENMPVPGIIHKYSGRILLILTGSCAVNCRYCFRREFDYQQQQITPSRWQACRDYINLDKSITEIIFSGGDPLMLRTSKLQKISNDLQEIPHIKRIRIHTRLPVVLPDRVNDNLCEWLNHIKYPVTIVLHINHAQEIDSNLTNACVKLRASGCQLLNQAVLLRGVNDSAKAQIALSEHLHEIKVLPYYLNLLDQVEGAAHFRVDDAVMMKIYSEMRQQLPGYLLPRLVRDDGNLVAKRQVFIDISHN